MRESKIQTSRIMTALTAVIIACGASAGVPDGYYDSIEGKCGVALKKAVKAVARNHTAIAYGDGSWEVFLTSDTRTVGGQTVWWDMYSSANVPVSSGHPGMNIEHGVPNSWWGGSKNDAYKDLFHLNPSDADANSRKGNYPLSELADITWDNGVTFVGIPVSGQGSYGGYFTRAYEPADEYKGDFARAYFYMFTVYDDIAWKSNWAAMYDTSSDLLLRPWAYDLLLKWDAQDPVSQKELDRNEAISKAQHNRNPFIDCPVLAQHIWGSKSNEGFVYDPTFVPDPTDPEDPPVGPVDPVTPDDPVASSGYWTLVTTAAGIEEGADYCLVSTTGEAMTCRLSSESGGYLFKSDISPVLDGDRATFSKMPDNLAIVTFTATGSGRHALGVRDPQGDFKGYLASSTAKKMTFSEAAAGAEATVSFSDGEVTIAYGSAGTLQYNASAPRFTTYTSTQTPLRLYRHVDISSGIGNVGADTARGMRIFDINGRLLPAVSTDGLQPGLYIIVENGHARKVWK